MPSRGFARDLGLNGDTCRDQRLGACFDLVLSRGPRLFWALTMFRSSAGASPYRSSFTFHLSLFTDIYPMRIWWKLHIVVLVASLSACSRPSVPCTNQVSSEELSPNGKFRAVVFHRSCQEWVGSTLTTNVSILRVGESPGDGNGNVLSYKGNIGVRAGWLSDQRLAIYSFADLRDATRLEAVGGVNVEYPKMVDADIVRPAAPAANPSGSVDGK